MKNLKKLSKKDLKAINGGGAPQCPAGYKACLKVGPDDEIKWTCIPSNLPCNP
jgi:bacteriocin-like protein